MEGKSREAELESENERLQLQLEEYKELIEAIRNGAIDALAINKDGKPDIFTLESTDYIYRVLVENFGEGALNVTDTGLIVYANTAFEHLLESTSSAIIGTELHTLVDKHSLKEFKRLFSAAFSGASSGEITLSFHKKKIPVYVSLSSLYPRFSGIGIIITDLSERKRREIFTQGLEEKLGEHAFLLQQILDSSMEMIVTIDPELRYTAVNRTALEFLEMKAEDILGKNVLDIHPNLASTEHFNYLLRALKGESFFKNNVNGIAREGLIYECNYKPLMTGTTVTGVLLMARNISPVVQTKILLEEMNRELDQKNRELVRKNTEISAFNSLALRKLREPLNKIRSTGEEIMRAQRILNPEQLEESFEKLSTASYGMQKLVDDLLTHSHISYTDSEMAETNLNNLLLDAKKILKPQILNHDVTIEVEKLPTLQVIPSQFQQIFIHLISNAIQFRKKSERLFIRILSEQVASGDANAEPSLPAGRYYKISLIDNGIGFDPVQQERIFELFQQLDASGEYPGTGVGLAICRKIVNDHKGFIFASGQPEKGSRFDIYLPLP